MYAFDRSRLAGLMRQPQQATAVAPNVLALGGTSLFTDISAEMVAAVLPIYMIFVLGLSPLQFGLVDGIYQGAAALAGLAGGLCADRWRRHREVAAAGYGLSALCKLGLLAAGPVWSALAGVIALDRVGKGIRTAPRDALISMSSEPHQVGHAFGVHRALDTAGALLGPLVAFAILAHLPDAYDVVFVSSFFIAMIGLATLLCFVRDPRPRAVQVGGGISSRPSASGSASAFPPSSTPESGAVTAHDKAASTGMLAVMAALLRQARFRQLLWAGMAISLVAVPTSFVYLLVQQRASLDAAIFPLLPVATSLSFLLLAIPAGRLGDRIGRARVFVFGCGALLAGCAALLLAPDNAWSGFVALGLLGVHFACTDGVLMAMASRLLPASQRASGLALLVTGIGVCRLLSSVLFGALWEHAGQQAALLSFVAALALVTAYIAAVMLRRDTAP